MNEKPFADATVTSDVTFADLGVRADLCACLVAQEIITPTPIQAAVIPVLLQGKDILGQAQTGTGKTAAYGLPLLQNIDPADPRIQGLVLAPTRELALQVCKALSAFLGVAPNTAVLAVYGGDSFSRQLHALQRGVQVVVATPGRLLDHLERRSIRLDGVRMVVLDEADEMLNMGFLEDVGKILTALPAQRQTALLSATLPSEIAKLADSHLREPQRIKIDAAVRAATTVSQRYTIVLPHLRAEAVARLLDVEPFEAALIFARTKATCDELTEALQHHGVACEALHGDLAQPAREAVVRRLRDGRLRVVVATDVAARGLDVPSLDLVVTIELPGEIGTYVHRIGRTGRAGRTGTSILVLGPRDERKLRTLERFVGQSLRFQPVPSPDEVAGAKQARFVEQIKGVAAEPETAGWQAIVDQCAASGLDLGTVAAALARMAAPAGVVPVLPEKRVPQPARPALDAPIERPVTAQVGADRHVGEPTSGAAVAPPERESPGTEPKAAEPATKRKVKAPERAFQDQPDRVTATPQWVVMSLGVGRRNNVTPAQLVQALTQTLNVSNRELGRIDLFDNYSTIEVRPDLARRMTLALRGVDVCGRFLNPRQAQPNPDEAPRRRPDRNRA